MNMFQVREQNYAGPLDFLQDESTVTYLKYLGVTQALVALFALLYSWLAYPSRCRKRRTIAQSESRITETVKLQTFDYEMPLKEESSIEHSEINFEQGREIPPSPASHFSSVCSEESDDEDISIQELRKGRGHSKHYTQIQQDVDYLSPSSPVLKNV